MALLISRGEPNRRLPDYRCPYSAQYVTPQFIVNDYQLGSSILLERARKANQPDFPMKDQGLDTKVFRAVLRTKDQGLDTKVSRIDLRMKDRGLDTKVSRIDFRMKYQGLDTKVLRISPPMKGQGLDTKVSRISPPMKDRQLNTKVSSKDLRL